MDSFGLETLCRYRGGIIMIEELSKPVLVYLVLNFLCNSIFLSKMLHLTFSDIKACMYDLTFM